MKREVFISYKSEESQLAFHIYEALQQNGITAWMAPQDIPTGSSYAVEITKAIKNCDIFLLLLSNAVQSSQWVPKELDAAINAKKRIIPFMVEKCNLNTEFGFFLSNVQHRDAYTDPEGALQNLISEIRGILGKPAPVKPKKEQSVANAPVNCAEELLDDGEKPVLSHAEAVNQVIPGSNKARVKEKQEKAKVKKGIIIAAAALVVLSVVLALFAGGMGSSGNILQKTITVAGKDIRSDVTWISISDTVVSQEDMEKLNEFTELMSLSFENCQIEATSFTEMPVFDLRYLTIVDCNMSQVFFDSIQVTRFGKLLRLDISGNPAVSNLQIGENELTALQELCIAGTAIADIGSVYANCAENLTMLDIAGTKITDIGFLANNQKLNDLDISGLGLVSLDVLTSCIYLEELRAAGNPLENTDGLQNLTILRVVDLSGCGLENVDFLGKSAETLTDIYLQNNKLTDLSVLSSSKKLKRVNVSENKLTSIVFLQNNTELIDLLASGNEITSIAGIEKMTAIKMLDLSYNKLTEVTIGAVFAEYAQLYLNGNEITSLTLTNEKHFDTLAVQGNRVDSPDYISKVSSSNLLVDYHKNMTAVDSFMNNHYNVTIYDCPLDQQVAVSQVVYGVEFATSSQK